MKFSFKKAILLILILIILIRCMPKRKNLAPFIEHYNKESMYTNHAYVYSDNDIYYISGSNLYKLDTSNNTSKMIKNYGNAILFLDSINNEIRFNYASETDRISKHNNGDYKSFISNENYDVIKSYVFDSEPIIYSSDLQKYFYEDGIVSTSQESTIYQYNETGMIVGFKGYKEYRSYYFEDIYIFCNKYHLYINKLDDSRKKFNEFIYFDIDKNSFIHGISKYDNLFYLIGREANAIIPGAKEDGTDPTIYWNYFYGDTIYTYDIEKDELIKLFETDNLIIRYNNEYVYYLDKKYNLFMYSINDDTTFYITNINNSTSKVENISDYIFFYHERDLLGIFDTRTNKLVNTLED